MSKIPADFIKKQAMKATKLYKYLDAQGGLTMLSKGNIQFTNATKLNAPFDCHPSLIDFLQVPTEKAKHPYSQDPKS